MAVIEMNVVMIEAHLAHIKAIAKITSTLHAAGESGKLHDELMILQHYLSLEVDGIEAEIYAGEEGRS